MWIQIIVYFYHEKLKTDRYSKYIFQTRLEGVYQMVQDVLWNRINRRKNHNYYFIDKRHHQHKIECWYNWFVACLATLVIMWKPRTLILLRPQKISTLVSMKRTVSSTLLLLAASLQLMHESALSLYHNLVFTSSSYLWLFWDSKWK